MASMRAAVRRPEDGRAVLELEPALGAVAAARPPGTRGASQRAPAPRRRRRPPLFGRRLDHQSVQPRRAFALGAARARRLRQPRLGERRRVGVGIGALLGRRAARHRARRERGERDGAAVRLEEEAVDEGDARDVVDDEEQPPPSAAMIAASARSWRSGITPEKSGAAFGASASAIIISSRVPDVGAARITPETAESRQSTRSSASKVVLGPVFTRSRKCATTTAVDTHCVPK